MTNQDTIEMNGQRFSVTYKREKTLVWATTYVNGREVKNMAMITKPPIGRWNKPFIKY